MHHTLKCDPQTQHDQYPCGEWDYLTYNKVYVHTGVYDSTLYYQPSFTYINNHSPDSVLIANNPLSNIFRYNYFNVEYSDTTNIENWEIGFATEYTTEVFPSQFHSGRSQYLWKADELTNSGLTAGPITGIKLHFLELSDDLDHLMIRMKAVNLEALTPDTLITGLDTVYYNALNPGITWNDLNFHSPFIWDGISDIVIDFGFTNPETGGEVINPSSCCD